MKKLLLFPVFCSFLIFQSCSQKNNTNKSENEKKEDFDMYDGPAEAAKFEFNRTKDPALGYVPTDRLLTAINAAEASKITSGGTVLSGTWVERGPNADVAGPYGNSRDPGNTASTSGRIRAMLVDAADATGKTVFIGGVDGGLWKTTDITVAAPAWTLINDNLSNLAVTAITQDPTNASIMYFCTGESYFNLEAVQGVGVFKSIDGGANWSLLSSTSSYTYCTRILCDYLGNIYLATRNGLFRSTKASGGATWTNITPSGMSTRICDLKISSTTASGRLHVVGGIFNTQSYRYADNPNAVTSSGFTAPTTPFPSYANRAEIAVNGNTLYALPANASSQVPTIYKSTDGGATWAGVTAPSPTWASGQGWYALAIDINPADANQCIIGGLDTYKTTDGGATWTKLTQWYGSGQQYMHADNHKIIWYGGGSKVLFGNDGGVFYSADGGTTITDRNKGLRIKQFYSCAIHPSSTNYFLAGAQDNGCHAFNSAGLGATTEITGGDGCFVFIDQDEPLYQFGSYVYDNYRRSTDGGATWSSIALSGANHGQFINPTDYDDLRNIMYSSTVAGSYNRWTDPQTGSTNADVTITALNGGSVYAVTVSPYTTNRVYFGTDGGKVCYVNNANSVASGSTGTDISTGLPASPVSCIATGTNDQNLMVSFSSYGVVSVWVSTNGGTSWTSIEGNLPDMPVRWCMFAPGDNSKAILATEAGVWVTTAINGASTVWAASPTFPAVRTDMLQYRPLDGLVAAATHGRGLWTQVATSILPLNNFLLQGTWIDNDVNLNWTFDDPVVGSLFELEASKDAVNFVKVGEVAGTFITKYNFTYKVNDLQDIFYRIKMRDLSGRLNYSNVINLVKAKPNNNEIAIVKFFPNPIINNANISFATPIAGKAFYTVYNNMGQKLWQEQGNLPSKGSYTLSEDFSTLKPGTYFFNININDKKAKYSFIKK